jgi:small-conductance mechanosensitive channel
MGIEFSKAIANIVWFVLLAIVVIVVVQQMGIEAQLLTDIFTYVIVILLAGLALAFGLGGRDVVRNVLAGFYAREMYKPGDHIIIDETEGVLQGIGSLNSEVMVGDNQIVIIPNTHLTENKITVRRGE